ncbi:MAG: hypothetical protein DRO13_01100 [Thermoprotei archaeon]|nr:MAG: hypothetical protein DRO13_01100 [Thermoprotei archaeon]
MGFGAVAASVIMILATMFVVMVVTYNAFAWFDYMTKVAEYTAVDAAIRVNVVLKIVSARYSSMNNTIAFNMTNEGTDSIIIGDKSDVVLDYMDTGGVRRLELLEYSRWYPVRLYIGNYTIEVSNASYVEIPPGTTCEIVVSPTYTLDPSYPVILVFATPSGVKSRYVFTP